MNFIFGSQPPPSVPCIPEQKSSVTSHLFCLKVLTAMHELQSGNSLNNDGVNSRDIVRYMQEKFNLDGDVQVQVHISLQQLLVCGFITKEAGKYKLVGPMARIIEQPQDSEARCDAINRVVRVFWSARRFSPCATRKLTTKQKLPIPLETEEDEEESCSETCYPIRKRKRSKITRSPLRVPLDSGSSSGLTDVTTDNVKRRHVRKTSRKRRSRTRDTSGTSRSRSRSRNGKRRIHLRKKEVEKSSSELLTPFHDTDPDCTCS